MPAQNKPPTEREEVAYQLWCLSGAMSSNPATYDRDWDELIARRQVGVLRSLFLDPLQPAHTVRYNAARALAACLGPAIMDEPAEVLTLLFSRAYLEDTVYGMYLGGWGDVLERWAADPSFPERAREALSCL